MEDNGKVSELTIVQRIGQSTHVAQADHLSAESGRFVKHNILNSVGWVVAALPWKPFDECHSEQGLTRERWEKTMRDIVKVTYDSIDSDPKIVNVITHEHPAENVGVSSRVNGEEYWKRA